MLKEEEEMYMKCDRRRKRGDLQGESGDRFVDGITQFLDEADQQLGVLTGAVAISRRLYLNAIYLINP